MRLIRKAGGAAVAALVFSAFVGGGASAQTATPETYIGTASGRALNLQVAQSAVTLGSSAARVDSTLLAVADSAGVLGLPIVGGANAGEVKVQGQGREEAAETCATPELPGVSAFVNLQAACSSSLAEIGAAGPHALGRGTVSKIDVSAETLAAEPISALTPVVEQIFGALEPALDSINQTVGTDLRVDDTVDELLTALGTTKTLEVRLGHSVSEVVTDGDKVTSTAISQGGVISILPVGAAGLKPVVEIVIGDAEASSVYDRATGKSTAAFDPAIVTIRVNTPTTDALGDITGVETGEIKIGPDLNAGLGAIATPCSDAANEFCVLEGTPFETRIAVASGRTVQNPDGTVGAIADAVKVHALKNIGELVAPLEGGILLELAHAEAGVGGAPAQAVPEIPRELPRTGGTPWAAIVAGAGLAMALAGRRVLARSV